MAGAGGFWFSYIIYSTIAASAKSGETGVVRSNGRTTIKTFYFMVQQAGVDLSEMGRRFPSNPQFPQPEGEELEYIGMVLSEDSNSLPQGEGSEGMRESSVDGYGNDAGDGGSYSETFSDKISLDDLPPIVHSSLFNKSHLSSDKWLFS